MYIYMQNNFYRISVIDVRISDSRFCPGRLRMGEFRKIQHLSCPYFLYLQF